ncbi:MAG: RdgB/HAM1 family non-canonical purine NTP pyrophosphatase [Acidobacteriota bacterium]
MQCLLATGNKAKFDEISAALAGFDLQLISARDCGIFQKPIESGTTFAENARLKARYYYHQTGIASLADDSGLVVDALGGVPGVHSARFAATDRARIEKLLAKLRPLDPKVGHRSSSARFVCALCLFAEHRVIEVEGKVEGEVVAPPRGAHGFGYDPVFYYPPLGKTFAEMSLGEKNRVSHRARALEKLRSQLEIGSWRAV